MKISRYLLLLLAVVVCGSSYAQRSQQELAQLMQQRNEYYFTFTLNGNDNLNAIAHAISVDRVDGNVVTAYANNDDFAKFQTMGYEVTLQTPPSMLEEHAMWDGSNRAEYDWDSYPTYEAYEAMMFQFATDHPDKCEIITLGTLSSGRKILIAHLNNGTANGKPKFLYTSTIHGDETTGWIMMLRLIDYLLENPNESEVQQVMNHLDLYICPNTNPDGTYHGGNHTVDDATRENANGVDMNRNYPDPHEGAHPDGKPYATETEWFMQLAQDVPFVMGANYHGGSEVLNYPWDNSYTLTADDAWWKLVCHEYADLCHVHNPNYMVLYDSDAEDGIINGALWYMIGGGRQDYMNGYAQCREVTIECSNSKLPNANQLPNFWTYNKEGIFAYMTQCLYGIHGTVTDRATGQPLNATITIEGHDDEFSFVESHLPAGDYHRPIKGGTYQVTYAKNGYYPQTHTVTVADGETVVLDVQLDAGQGLIPDFNASATVIAPNTSVNFTDNTWGPYLASWAWTFEGGEPATSSLQNPTVTYNQTGTFDVTLTVTNEDGQVETITKPDFITVRDSYNMHNGDVTTCDAMFYDNGGPNGNYSNRKTYTMTFYPGMDNHMIRVNFSEFSLEADYDFLYIYDGTSTNATEIGSYTGGTGPEEVTATNSQGALTFQFTSDQAVNAAGWKAHVTCFDPLSVDETQIHAMVYPNPSQGSFTVKTEGEMEYHLCNSIGQRILSGHFCDETLIEAKHLSQGVYFLQLIGTQGNHVEKIVIEK